MSALKGWKTVIFGFLMIIVPSALNYIGGIDWTSLGISPGVSALIGAVVIMLRALTTTGIGKPVGAIALLLAAGLALSACAGGAQTTGCAIADKLQWLVDEANTKFAGKYAADAKMAEDLLKTAACTSGDWTARAEAVAVKLVADLWQVKL